MNCHQELCPNWSGDGDACPCAVFGVDPPVRLDDEDDYREHDCE